MKKSDQAGDDLRAKYVFSSMKRGVRGERSRRVRDERSNIVLLDPDVAATF